MAKTMALDVLVRLKDKLSGPLRGLRNQLRSLVDFARKISLLGAAIATISFMGPIQEAAAFQQKLLDIAQTADLSGKAAFAFVDEARSQYEALAIATGQLSDTIASGAGRMIAAGLDRSLIDATIKDIARAATGANAEFADMADVATSMMQTLKLPAGELNDSMGALIVSGKLGAFELKDMARYFPTLTSQVAKFGVKGREAINFLGSALQIARKGTADPAEAANNLKNFLSKISSPATIKNFKKLNVDIEAVMKDAATKGINPIEAVLQKITKLTGVSGQEIQGMLEKAKANGLEGADALASVREQLTAIKGAGALGEIFADQQVMDFLIPFLANVDEYKKIKQEVAAATGAVIDDAFGTQMAGLNRQLTIFKEIGTQASREVGFAFGAWLPTINGYLGDAIAWYREWNKQTDGLGSRILTMAGGGVLLATALGALGFVLPVIGAGFAALGALLSPVGLAIAGLAAGAVYLYRNWDTYGAGVMKLWQGAKEGFMSLVDTVADYGGRMLDAGRALFDAYGPTISKGLSSAWAAVKRGFASFVGFTKRLLANGKALFDRFGPQIAAGLSRGWEAVKRQLFALPEMFDRATQAVKGAFSDFSSGFFKALPDFGASFDRQFENLKRIGAAFSRIGSAIARFARSLAGLFNIDSARFDSFFETLGGFAGGAVSGAVTALENIGSAIATVSEGIADLLDGTGRMGEIGRTIGDGFKSIWDALKDFGSGFAKSFPDMSESLGKIGESLRRFGDAISKIGSGITSLTGLSKDSFGGFFEFLGKIAGAVFSQAIGLFEKLALASAKIAEGLAWLVNTDFSIDWAGMLPDSVVATWQKLADAINTVREAIDSWTKPNAEIQTKVNNVVSLDEARRVREAQSTLFPGSTENQPGKLKDDRDVGRIQPKAMPAPKPQEVEVGGTVVIKVEGPGEVVSTTSVNKAVPLATGKTGRIVGGV